MRLFVLFFALLSAGCGDAQKDKGIEGYRWQIVQVRARDAETWTATTGVQEWAFYKSGLFRQFSDGYVEPPFYDSLQACSGVGSGTFSNDKSASKLSLKYEGRVSIQGLCEMEDRTLGYVEQESGELDLSDGLRVIRLKRVGEAQ